MAISTSSIDQYQESRTTVRLPNTAGPQGWGVDLYQMAGVVGVDFSGTGSTWRHEDLDILLPPRFTRNYIVDVTPGASLGNVAAGSSPQGAGWGVDNCTYYTRQNSDSTDQIVVRAHIVVRIPGSVLVRVAFHATATVWLPSSGSPNPRLA